MSHIAKNTSRNRAIKNYVSGSMLQNSLIIRNGDLYLISKFDIDYSDEFSLDKSQISQTDVITSLNQVELV